MKEQIASDHLASKGSEVAAFGAGVFSIITSVVSFFTSFTVSEWAGTVGIVVALSGWIYRHRESKLVSSKTIAEKELIEAQKIKVMAEVDEINRRGIFMERAGMTQLPYHTPSPELEALKPEGEQEA